MTFRMSPVRFATLIALFALIVAPVFTEAQSKRRAVRPGSGQSAATPNVTLSGVILDSVTNNPVISASVNAGSHAGRSDAQGKFTVSLPPGASVNLHFERTGYQPLDTTVSITSDATQTFRLIPKPTVSVRLTNGSTLNLDEETVEFGYVVPFSGYSKDTHLNLSKGGGEAYSPDREEIKRITTGVQLNDAKCCASAIPAVNVESKAGGTTTGGFVDACLGYKEDIIGLDHAKYSPVYLHFSDIAEIVFP